jgi:hypothetical protein
MELRKLVAVIAILCLCVGAAWAQNDKSISTVYRVNVIIAANNVSPQTTSMLFIDTYVINSFDGVSVNWEPKAGNIRHGIIISSGVHILTGRPAISGTGVSYQYRPLNYDFRPGGFYYITATGTTTENNFQFRLTDLTNNINWSPEKQQIERIIQQHSNTTVQPGQGTRPSQGGGLQGALDRAANTVMANLQQGDTIAIISFTGENAQFAQEELEVVLVNNRFSVVDRATLDKIRQEQQFQLTGDVDDQTAVSIGKFAGARVVITGSVSGSGDMRRLRLRALDTQTARVLAAASEAF